MNGGHDSGVDIAGDTGPLVLVIDDDDFMRAVVIHLLHRLDVVSVVEAANGTEAYAAIQGGNGRDFDLLICDLGMPESDGMEFMRRIGELGGAAPLLVLSGESQGVLHSVEIMGKAYGLRILGAAQKPPTLAILRDALARCRDLPRGKRPVAQWNFSAAELREALDLGQFEPFFQPKVQVATGVLSGCEALVRWRHPVHGVLPPAAFITDIQAQGLMEDLSAHMLREAAGWCRRWRHGGWQIPVSVNLAMSSFEDPELGERIIAIVQSAGLVASDLILEVTETMAMADVARCLETLVRLRLKGFGLAIDDFGTGFSSLQQLERVPFTELKIDREFVAGASGQLRQRAMLQTSIAIARELGLVSVGEGVETADDWACLHEMGCNVAQGYYIAKPMSGSEFMAWMEDWRQVRPSRIPACAAHAADRVDGQTAAPPAVAEASEVDRAPVILAADDEPIARRSLELFLAEIPCEKEIFGDGQQLLEAVDRMHPDLVLVDIDMPGLRGDEVCRRMRLVPETAGIPVIIITGDETVAARRSALIAGATDFVTKPLQKEEFLMRVRNLLALQKSQRELSRSRLMLEAQKSRQVRQTFERYVSPRLVDRILRSEALETQVGLLDDVRRCHAIVLFADLRGFTHMSEVLEPPVVAGILNEFFELLVGVTHLHDGTTLSMAGDCLMIAFNVPYAQPDAALRGVRAARAMLLKFEAMAGGWERAHGVRTGLGVGINAGSVVAGNIGAQSYLNFTLIGDAVNVAARLKDRARAGEILITQELLDELAGTELESEFVKIPVVVLKGKSRPMDVFSIVVTPRSDAVRKDEA